MFLVDCFYPVYKNEVQIGISLVKFIFQFLHRLAPLVFALN